MEFAFFYAFGLCLTVLGARSLLSAQSSYQKWLHTWSRKKVTGKIVLITGSANGIGKQLTLNFANRGAILVLWDIDEEGNKETAMLARRHGALAVYTYKCDVGNREEVYAVADQVKQEVGNVNILVNNAAILNGKYFLDLSDSEMIETMNVNAKAHFWTIKAFLPAMIAFNEGHLVTIGSSASLSGANKLSDYCASKFAEFGLLESVAFELWSSGKKEIKTTMIFLGFVNTEEVTGVQTKRPFLFPIMDVEYAARKIMDAILKEKLYAFIPPAVQAFSLKVFLPKKAVFLLADYAGIFNALDHFKGRLIRGEKKCDSLQPQEIHGKKDL